MTEKKTPAQKTRAQRLKEKTKEIEQEVRGRMIGYILGGLGVVAGLAWNDAIKAAIDKYFPTDKSSIIAQFIYAAIITTAIVIVGIYLTKLSSKKE